MFPEAWESRAGSNDKRNPELIGTDGIVSGYEDLLARTDVKRIAKEIDPKVQQQRHEANQRGIAKVAEALKKAKPDILVMFGDDQQEYLTDDNMPGFCIYWGDEVTADEAAAMRLTVGKAFEGVELEVVEGGQPHYHLIMSIE